MKKVKEKHLSKCFKKKAWQASMTKAKRLHGMVLSLHVEYRTANEQNNTF